jgi:hypothetical protein
MNKDDVDRLFTEGMKKGDAAKMYAHADERLRKRFTLGEIQAFLDKRPGILERENLVGLNFMSTRVDGADYVKVTNKPGFFYDNAWDIVFKVVDGEYILVGISPGLDDFVPGSFRIRGRRLRHH